MSSLRDLRKMQPDATLSLADTMVRPGGEQEYFDLGRRALEIIQWSGEICAKPHYSKILDLPCGHGRVLRWLCSRYGSEKIVACDLERSGVDFCERQFGVKGVYSKPELSEVELDRDFDLVWCGSLLTHLPIESWERTLQSLLDLTRECGVFVFSTQGRYYSSLLARERSDIAENIDKGSLLKNFQANGFAYEPYYEHPEGDYGVTVVSPEFVGRLIQRFPGVILRGYLEQAWGIQDIVILYKKQGYFEPLLGDVGEG